MIPRKKIFALSGSVRKNSSNNELLRLIASDFSHQADIEIMEGINTLPHFNPDVHDSTETSVQSFREKIQAADGVLLCTPEYVFSLPGSFKNALEWTVSTMVFAEKPVAIIVASSAGEMAFESLKLIMRTLGARIEDKTCLLIQGARAKVSPPEKETYHQITKLMNAFMESMNQR